jgi:hypothetical protein
MMTLGLRLLLLQALLLVSVAATLAQTPAENLRAQLRETEARETELRERAAQLDEQMRPENIERSLALTGSTRPEELREQRRRELEKERESVRLQLDQLAASRTRLEAAIATADAEAYRRSALPSAPTVAPQTNADTVQSPRPAQKQRRRSARRQRRRRT